MDRDPARAGDEAKRKERLGFIVLQHIHTLTDEAAGALLPELIATDLAINLGETRELLTALVDQGFVAWDGGNGTALSTREGANYVLRVAGRRRSVRFHSIGTGTSSRADQGSALHRPERSTASPAPASRDRKQR